MFRKAAFLEISRRSFLIGVAGLQYSVCNATKNELLTKCLKCALKLTENFTEVISTEVSYQKRVFKGPKVAPMGEFLSSETGTSGFSAE